MNVPEDGAERLAEIFREIFALSETNRANDSKSTFASDSIKLFDSQAASGPPETCASKRGEEASDGLGEAEDQESRR